MKDFDEFYERYPRKVGKGSARKAYSKAIKSARHEDIMYGLSLQMPALLEKEKQFIAHPATWLNGQRWLDEVESEQSNNQKNTRADAASYAITYAGTARRSPSRDCF